MCGRFSLTATPEEVEDLLGPLDFARFPPRYNIAPTQPVLMVLAGDAGEKGANRPRRRALLVRWGLIPGWCKEPRDIPLLINARSETAAQKASFRAAMRHRRALVPASGFYEWKREPGKRSQPYWVRPTAGGIVLFAGLVETWHAADGSEIDTGAILTTAASADIASIHDRMPAVIRPENVDEWLDCLTYQPGDVAGLLHSPPPAAFEAIPVSTAVNRVANSGPEVQLPLAAEAEPPPPTEGKGQMPLL